MNSTAHTSRQLDYLTAASQVMQTYYFRCEDTLSYAGKFPQALLSRAPDFYQKEAIRNLRKLVIEAQENGALLEALALMHAITLWEEEGTPPTGLADLLLAQALYPQAGTAAGH